MRVFVFTAASVVLFLAVSASPVQKEGADVPVIHSMKAGTKCPAKFFYLDCNSCVCGTDGYSAACTLKACIPDDAGTRVNRAANDDDENVPHLDFFEVTGQCFAGEYFYDKCNICHCDYPSGTGASCTLMECGEPKHPHIDGYKQGMKCPAGKAFYDDCNACVCGDDGVSAGCTLMQCPGKAKARKARTEFPHIDNFDEIQKCTPGKLFKNKCNTCECNVNGRDAACTLMACPEYQ